MALAQAVAGPVLPSPPRPRSDAPCPVTQTADVVVCGRADDHYRLRPLPPRAEEPPPPKAETRIFGNATLAAEAEQAQMLGGQQSQRAMIRLKIPFGGKKKE